MKQAIKKNKETVLLMYFADLSRQYFPSSMWLYYYDLRLTLVNIENSLLFLNKREEIIHQESKILSQEEIFTFLLNALDEVYLMMKVNYSYFLEAI